MDLAREAVKAYLRVTWATFDTVCLAYSSATVRDGWSSKAGILLLRAYIRAPGEGNGLSASPAASEHTVHTPRLHQRWPVHTACHERSAKEMNLLEEEETKSRIASAGLDRPMLLST